MFRESLACAGFASTNRDSFAGATATGRVRAIAPVASVSERNSVTGRTFAAAGRSGVYGQAGPTERPAGLGMSLRMVPLCGRRNRLELIGTGRQLQRPAGRGG